MALPKLWFDYSQATFSGIVFQQSQRKSELCLKVLSKRFMIGSALLCHSILHIYQSEIRILEIAQFLPRFQLENQGLFSPNTELRKWGSYFY